jgi:RNA polymerase sigma-70 factor, ECF subfamily
VLWRALRRLSLRESSGRCSFVVGSAKASPEPRYFRGVKGDNKARESRVPMDANTPTTGNAPRDEEFVRLFGLNQGRVFAYIVTLLPRWADAEEVLQRTSLVLWRKFDQFDLSTNFVRWACAVAYREALKYLKQQSRQQQVFKEAVLEKLSQTRIAHSDLFENRHLAIDDCVAELAPSDRAIIEHYYYQGRKTAAEVAKELGRPTNTILKALIRIRGNLQRCIDNATSSGKRK